MYSFSYYVRDWVDIKYYQGDVNKEDARIIGVNFKRFSLLLKSIKLTLLKDSKAKKYFQIDVVLENQDGGWGQRLANIGFYMLDVVYERDKTTGFIFPTAGLKSHRIYTSGEGRFGLTADNGIASGNKVGTKYLGTGFGSQQLIKLQMNKYYEEHSNETDIANNEILGPKKDQSELNEYLNNVVPTDQELPLTQDKDGTGGGLSFKTVGDNIKYDVNYIDFLDYDQDDFKTLAFPEEITAQNNASYNRFLKKERGHSGYGETEF